MPARTCPRCQGSGTTWVHKTTANGKTTTEHRPCRGCGGTGQVAR